MELNIFNWKMVTYWIYGLMFFLSGVENTKRRKIIKNAVEKMLFLEGLLTSITSDWLSTLVEALFEITVQQQRYSLFDRFLSKFWSSIHSHSLCLFLNHLPEEITKSAWNLLPNTKRNYQNSLNYLSDLWLGISDVA